jgi:predicted RNA-binding Zn-ribbon protein involved in translation (DUF1610 family)
MSLARSVLISGEILVFQVELHLTIMSETACPDCAVEMDQIERTTFTGRDMREYQCPKCGRKQIVDCGKALWEILSEANRKDDPEP